MIFRNMINKTKACLQNTKPKTHAGQIKCETALFSEGTDYTYHTHPNGINFPSQPDIQTTAKHKKKVLMIGLVPTNEVVVWGYYPTYDRMVARFKV